MLNRLFIARGLLAATLPTGDVVAGPPSDTMLEAGGRIIDMGTIEQLARLAERMRED